MQTLYFKRLKYHMTNEHSVKCALCPLTFESNNKLQDHENTLHSKKPPAIKNAIHCKYCEFVCSDEDVLKKHVKKEHRTRCNKCFITFKDLEAKNIHIWENHPTTS